MRQPTPLPLAELAERQTALRQACDQIGRLPILTRMSFRVEISTVTRNALSSGGKRPVGYGTLAEVASDLLIYREKAGLDAFQINFHGNRNLDQLLQSMECFTGGGRHTKSVWRADRLKELTSDPALYGSLEAENAVTDRG